MEKNVYWRGVEGVNMIWHGEWSDPELEYDGKVVNYFDVENTMCERYKEECKYADFYHFCEDDDKEFNRFCQDYAEDERSISDYWKVSERYLNENFIEM